MVPCLSWGASPTAPSDDPGRLVATYRPLGSQDGVPREKQCCISAPCRLWMQGDRRWFCSPPCQVANSPGAGALCTAVKAKGRPQKNSSTAPSCPAPDSSEQNSEGRGENTYFLPCSLPPSLSFQLSSAKLLRHWQSLGLHALAHPRLPVAREAALGGWVVPMLCRTDPGHKPTRPRDAKPPRQATVGAEDIHPHCSVTKSHPCSEHKPGACWIGPHAPAKPSLSPLLAGAHGSAGCSCCMARWQRAALSVQARESRAALPISDRRITRSLSVY